MTFSTEQLISTIRRLAPDATGYWVAYSGGLDSHVLLHALAAQRDQLPAPLVAVHVNHNLQTAAVDWEAHCRAVCADLGVEYRSLSVDARGTRGDSPEAAARAARYQVFTEVLPAGHVLLTAHHQDDQAETLLLQLLRGAGPKGLAAMPAFMDVAWVERQRNPDCAALHPGYPVRLARPLLECSRDDLHAYAQEHDLKWIDDPSNARTDYDRNFLRHEILPRLRTRWPAAGATLARAARHQAEAAQLLEELAEIDTRGQSPISSTYVESSSDQVRKLGSDPDGPDPGGPLSVSRVLTLSAPRRANLLRHWLHQGGAPLPSTAILARIEQDLLLAAVDARPCVAWGGVCARRYRDNVYLDQESNTSDDVSGIPWSMAQPLSLAGGILTAEPGSGQGVATRHLTGRELYVAFRQGGERLQPVGRREHHTLKHLFQDAGVPPWERKRVPLLYLGETLIAVAGYWVCEGFQAAERESGVRFIWSRAIVPDGSFW